MEGVAGCDAEGKSCRVDGHKVGRVEDGEPGGEGEERISDVSVSTKKPSSSPSVEEPSSRLVDEEKVSRIASVGRAQWKDLRGVRRGCIGR